MTWLLAVWKFRIFLLFFFSTFCTIFCILGKKKKKKPSLIDVFFSHYLEHFLSPGLTWMLLFVVNHISILPTAVWCSGCCLLSTAGMFAVLAVGCGRTSLCSVNTLKILPGVWRRRRSLLLLLVDSKGSQFKHCCSHLSSPAVHYHHQTHTELAVFLCMCVCLCERQTE